MKRSLLFLQEANVALPKVGVLTNSSPVFVKGINVLFPTSEGVLFLLGKFPGTVEGNYWVSEDSLLSVPDNILQHFRLTACVSYLIMAFILRDDVSFQYFI